MFAELHGLHISFLFPVMKGGHPSNQEPLLGCLHLHIASSISTSPTFSLSCSDTTFEHWAQYSKLLCTSPCSGLLFLLFIHRMYHLAIDHTNYIYICVCIYTHIHTCICIYYMRYLLSVSPYKNFSSMKAGIFFAFIHQYIPSN
jgi:hypothetical protein